MRVGLPGLMGGLLALKLLKAGFPFVAFDIDAAKRQHSETGCTDSGISGRAGGRQRRHYHDAVRHSRSRNRAFRL